MGVNFPNFFVLCVEVLRQKIAFLHHRIYFLFLKIANLRRVFFRPPLFYIERVRLLKTVQTYLGENFLFSPLVVEDRLRQFTNFRQLLISDVQEDEDSLFGNGADNLMVGDGDDFDGSGGKFALVQ